MVGKEEESVKLVGKKNREFSPIVHLPKANWLMIIAD